MKIKKKLAIIGAVVATLVAGFLAVTAPAAQAGPAQYYILIGGTCDGNANAYREEWLRGGIRKAVPYPAGAFGVPGCDWTPMDRSVAIGHESARRVVQDSFNENPGGRFTIVGYSQGAIVANKVLNDIADGRLAVDKSRFSAKLYADPMQPAGPPGRGISAILPEGFGLPSPLSGYVSFGPGRADFGGIPFIRYCIVSDGVCHFDTIEALGGYFAQHQCYWQRPIMADTLADGVFNNRSQPLPKQDCRPPWPA
jgi:hypothetical protein